MKFSDGREVEIHSPDAIEIYKREFAMAILGPQTQSVPEAKRHTESSGQEGTVSDEVPKIKAAAGTMDNLRLLLSTPWAKKGRLVADFVKALETNAAPDLSKNVSKNLSRLVKSGEARRIPRQEGYCYYPVSSAQQS